MAEAGLRPPLPRLHIGARAMRNGALVALVLLFLFNAVATRDFLTLQTFNVNLSQVAQVVVVAMGMALVVATGGIDLSVGATAAFAGTLAAVLLSQPEGLLAAQPALALAAALVLPLLAGAGFGAVNGTLIARFGIQPIVATLVLFIAGRGFAEMLTESNLRTFSGVLAWLRGNLLGVPVQGFLMLAVVAVTAWAMRATVFSRWVLAVGGNERAARLSGVPAGRVKLAVYMLCGMLAALAGIMNVAMISAADPARIGQNIELDAIAAVAVGGTLLTGGRANIVGTLVGAVLIQLLRYTLLAHGVADEYALLVTAGIILLAVWLQRREA